MAARASLPIELMSSASLVSVFAKARAVNVTVCVDSEAAATAVRAVTPRQVPVVVGRPDHGDIVLVRETVRLASGWFDALLAARGDDGTVATVDAVVVDVADVAAAQARLSSSPSIPSPRAFAPQWACTLVTRSALDLAGPLDDQFAARCSALGLLHVVASDALAASSPAPPSGEPEPVRRVRARAEALADELAVTFDARILRAPVAGTQVHALELLAALHRTGRLRLRA